MPARHISLLAPALFAACSLALLAPPARAADAVSLCNAVQNRVGFIRYPLGTVGAWSNGSGEMADVMTRVPRVYPCLDAPVVRPGKEDWRATITGDPSQLRIAYRADKPCGATTLALTVTPHVSVFQFTFPDAAAGRHLVFDLGKGAVDGWSALAKWTNRTITRIDAQTFQATLGKPGAASRAHYVIRFSAPCAAFGSIDPAGKVSEGANSSTGVDAALYARFDAATVTVAIAESFTSMERASAFLAAEFTDFAAAQQRCRAAWKEVLDRVELDAPAGAQRMAYTAIYTMIANTIDGSDGSCYRAQYAHPRSVASSTYWQFIGGFQCCCWDNSRAAYPFLALAYPELMTDVVNTYLARSERDGWVDGNACLFTGPVGNHRSVAFGPVLAAQAQASGVPADYAKLYAALKATFGNDAHVPATLATLGYVTQPPTGGKACSETLEYATGAHALAVLARTQRDPEAARTYWRLGRAYANLWDRENRVFRVKNADGSWGPIDNAKWTWNPNPQGLFEGTSQDWAYSVPHDPQGLVALPGQENFAQRVAAYCLNDTWFNDNQYCYPYLLYYAGAPGAPGEAQRIVHDTWVPLFQDAVMFEGVRPKVPHNGWQTHYTSNSGWLACAMLGLYPLPAPPGQFILATPSVKSAVIHRGDKEIRLETTGGSATNIYLKGIKLDGQPYPCYFVPAQRLARGVKIELELGGDPAPALGDLYIASTDGLILSAELPTAGTLRFTVEPAVEQALTKVHARQRPAQVLVDGRPSAQWTYDAATQTLSIATTGQVQVEVR